MNGRLAGTVAVRTRGGDMGATMTQAELRHRLPSLAGPTSVHHWLAVGDNAQQLLVGSFGRD
ncbi:hypothetical protein [Streptomyces coeruleorubidus]|uniref:hypothetical protein n=1 Tax=Streptomyces coeruleorubidus TaxID=116188 RepID=UPI0036CBE2E0